VDRWDRHLTGQLIVDKAPSVLRQWVRHCRRLGCSHGGCGAVFGVVSWVDTGVAGFTKKSGVFFAYGVHGPEFFPALYIIAPGLEGQGFTKTAVAWKDLLSVVPRISDQFHPRCCSFIMQFLVELFHSASTMNVQLLQPLKMRRQSKISTILARTRKNPYQHLYRSRIHTSSDKTSLAPPFNEESANTKVKAAQDLWNTQYVSFPSNHLHSSVRTIQSNWLIIPPETPKRS